MNPPDAVCRIEVMAQHRIGISTNLRVMPYVRMTQRSKWQPRSRAYNAAQRTINEAVGNQMGVDSVEPFPAGVRLGFSATIWAAPYESWVMPNEKRRGYWRTYHPGRDADLGNFVKALEDAIQGSLYGDDKQIREYGRCRVLEGEEDRFEVEVWEL